MSIPTREELQTLRDELKVRIHLGSKELQDAWEDLEARWRRFEAQAELDKTRPTSAQLANCSAPS